MKDGFDARGLDEHVTKLIDIAEKKFPKDTKKFLKKQGIRLNMRTKQYAKAKITKKTGNYMKGFKAGKAYYYAPEKSYAVRVYNNSPHAHLIEDGHEMCNKKGKNLGIFVKGKKILETSADNYKDEFVKNIEGFVDDLLEKGLG